MLRRLTLLFVAFLGLAGCNKTPPPPPPVAVPAPPPPVAPVPGPAAPSAPAVSGPAPSAGTGSRSPSKIDPSIPEDKVFLVDAEVGNFDVADPSVRPDDEFLLETRPEKVSEVVVVTTPAAGTITAKLPDGFTAIPAAGATAEGWPRRIRCTADGAEMAYVPGGVFRQGVDGGPADAGPAHPAYVDPYYIDIHETTLERYFKCRSTLKEEGRPTLAEPANSSQPQNHPATGVMWRDAAAYAKWAKKELPTEAEWEMAGRGNKSFNYPWGNDRAIWERARVPGGIAPVGTYRSDVSIYGVFDLAGNAREWCADLFSADYYAGAKERDGSPIRNPQGPRASGTVNHRVAKGGKTGWQLWHRSGESMQKGAPDLGFRCVLRLPLAEEAKAR